MYQYLFLYIPIIYVAYTPLYYITLYCRRLAIYLTYRYNIYTVFLVRRGVRVAYGDGLENRCPRKRTVGSNPTPSAINSKYILHSVSPSPDHLFYILLHMVSQVCNFCRNTVVYRRHHLIIIVLPAGKVQD